MPQLLKFTTSYGCQASGGFIKVETASGYPADADLVWAVIAASTGADYGGPVLAGTLPQVNQLPDDSYEVSLSASDSSGSYTSGTKDIPIACAGQPGALRLGLLSHTDETAALNDGTATIQASGGVAPLTATLVELSASQPATAGQPALFDDLPPSTYTLRVTDNSTPTPQVVSGEVTVLPYAPPVAGCQDEYADNYDPAATSGGAASCTYTPRWRSVWGPAGMAVRVPAVAGQTTAYIAAELRIGFRAGHPLADARPLGEPLALRATVGPDGYATFRLAPYLWPALGSDDGAGRRLDLNAPDSFGSALFTGYELRRTTAGELLEHGYALNAAVPDAQLITRLDADGNSLPLSPFTQALPVWPGFDDYQVALVSPGAKGFDSVGSSTPDDFGLPTYRLPCPANPVPVAWLAPGGGFGYWVFSGRPQLSDEVGESQGFTEALSGERRWSQRGESRGTITASSGVFNGTIFGEGLRTLWASPQVWYQPQPGGVWVPVTLEGGSFPVRRVGLARTEVSLTFTEAVPHYAQGQ